jgi:outer membrane protein OmpA-like peptidoglycan-associated protein
MKRKHISGIVSALLFPLLVAGQSQTYTVDIAKFSSKKYDDFSPVYYKHGIVFCSNRNNSLFLNYLTPENKGLLKINFADTITGRVRLFSKNLRTKFNDGPASFSSSGDTIYFSRNLKVNGTVSENSNPRNKLGIFTAVLEDDEWVKILDIRFNNEYYNITTPYISPDGKRLFFASDNPAGFGGTDLYYCNWRTDYWDEPVSMGPEINTAGNESYPFVDREGGVFFSSDGHPGLGGKDIFYTKQLGTRWLPPVALEPPINSKYDDFALIADSVMNQGYFSSKRGNTVDLYHYRTNVHQIFYCESQRTNEYCFKFTDEGKIPIDDLYIQLVWSFGDGSTAIGQNVEHCFKGPGRYNVRLDAVDKNSGRVFFPKLSYNLDLTDIEQPVIISPVSGIAGGPVNLDGMSSHFPGFTMLNYTWNFGDGDRKAGEKVSHSYLVEGDYAIKLGLIVRNDKTGVIRQTCSSRKIKILGNKLEKTVFDKREIKPEPLKNITNYDHAKLQFLYSLEKDYNQDMVFQVEVLSSKTKLALDDKAFKNLPGKYTIKEEFIPAEKLYSYVVDEETSLMATYPAYNEISNLGFGNSRIRAFLLEDQASKDLNNLKKVLGVSADVYFKKNDFNLTSAGTQFLDQILGFMSKYPTVKLEIENHTDNTGSATSNQLLSQKRAEAMTNYLVINGVNPLRLTAKGYGGSKPVASNYLESDRKLNRRIDFTVFTE